MASLGHSWTTLDNSELNELLYKNVGANSSTPKCVTGRMSWVIAIICNFFQRLIISKISLMVSPITSPLNFLHLFQQFVHINMRTNIKAPHYLSFGKGNPSVTRHKVKKICAMRFLARLPAGRAHVSLMTFSKILRFIVFNFFAYHEYFLFTFYPDCCYCNRFFMYHVPEHCCWK